MDPVSIIVSVAGLASLCTTVSKAVDGFLGKSDDENRALEELRSEVTNLLGVVKSFDKTLKATGADHQRWKCLSHTLSDCHRIMGTIESMFNTKAKAFTEFIGDTIKPDNRSKDIQRLAGKITRYRQELILALLLELCEDRRNHVSQSDGVALQKELPALSRTDEVPSCNTADICDKQTPNEEEFPSPPSCLKPINRSGGFMQRYGEAVLPSFCDCVCSGTEPAAYRLLESMPTIDRDAALRLTVHHGKETIVRALLENGADVEAREKDGQPVLIVAARKGYKGICRLLIDGGANIEVRDSYAETALMLAAMHGSVEVVQLLLECNANVKAVNRWGLTAQALAQRKKRYNIADLLENYERRRGKQSI